MCGGEPYRDGDAEILRTHSGLKCIVVTISKLHTLCQTHYRRQFKSSYQSEHCLVDVVLEAVPDTASKAVSDAVTEAVPVEISDAVSETVLNAVYEAVSNTVSEAVSEAVQK